MPLEDQLLAAAGEEDVAPEIASEPEVTPEITPEPEVTTEETVAEVTGESTAETPPTQTELRLAHYIKEQFGEDYTGKYKTDNELLRGLVHASKKIGERDDDAQLGRFIRDRPQEAFQWLQQQMGMTPAQAAQTVQQEQRTTPEFDPEWDRIVELDEHGRAIGVKPGNDPSIATKFNAAMKYARERQRDLIFNPDKALQPLLTQAEERAVQKARAQWEQEISSRYGQMAEQQEAQQVLNTNKNWLFVNGDPGSGQLTAAGRVYKETVDLWHQRHPNMSSVQLNEIALNSVYAKFPPQKKVTAKPGAPTKTINVQTPTKNQDIQRREGETALEFFTRVDNTYNMIPNE